MRPHGERAQSPDEDDGSATVASEVELADPLRAAIERGDVAAALRLLEADVVARDGRSLAGTARVALDDLALAPRDTGYRTGAATSALRALGDAQVAELLIELLDRTDGTRSSQPVAELLRARPAIHAEVRRLAFERGPRVAAQVEAVLPGSVALRPGEVAGILGILRATEDPHPEWMSDTIRRVACGVLVVDGPRKKALEPLLFAIAATDHPHAPAALEALFVAGVRLDRERDGATAMETALIQGARDNAEKLRTLGSPRPREAVLQAAAHASSVSTFAARRKARRAALGPDPDGAELRAKARATSFWKASLGVLLGGTALFGGGWLVEQGSPLAAAFVVVACAAALYRVLTAE